MLISQRADSGIEACGHSHGHMVQLEEQPSMNTVFSACSNAVHCTRAMAIAVCHEGTAAKQNQSWQLQMLRLSQLQRSSVYTSRLTPISFITVPTRWALND
jgi:hypothetical protein